MPQHLELDAVSFGYDTAQSTLFEDLTLSLGPGWHGLIGANGAGKTTLLRLLDGTLTPRTGRVIRHGTIIVCPQRTDHPPDGFVDFLASPDRLARRLIGQLGIEDDWLERWPVLSHGERKRAQIGWALSHEPSVLALDEPTNHVDREARDVIGRLLKSFRGIGLLVSHDRMLLDLLCSSCLLVAHGRITVYPGTYTEAMAVRDQDDAAAARAHEQARKTRKRLQKTAADRRRQAAEADGRRSKRGLGARDHDAKSRIDAARVSGKDGQAGRLQAQLDGRLRQAAAREADLHHDRRPTLGMTMRGVPARSATLYQSAAQQLPISPGRVIELPELTIRPTDRIGIVGPNGAGKSTLVRHLLTNLTLDARRLVTLPQEIEQAEAAAIRDELLRLDTRRRGDVLAAIDCLGSDPARILETESLSPGEVRKLILALGLAREPHLVIMDEPTNHLDLPSIECLERALGDLSCAVVLVSHDDRFLRSLVSSTWTLSDDRPTAGLSIRASSGN